MSVKENFLMGNMSKKAERKLFGHVFLVLSLMGNNYIVNELIFFNKVIIIVEYLRSGGD